MKAKLILKHRGDYDYFLISRTDNSEALIASLTPDGELEEKLSKQNCDEIFGVVDVEKLANSITIEVEIEMDAVPADRAPNGWSTFPKLDSNGCLILKRVV